MDFITKLQLYRIWLSKMDVQLDRITSLVSLGIYECPGIGSILSNFTNPKLKEYCVQLYWDTRPDDDLFEPFFFIKKFQGLETLVINMHDQKDLYPSLLKVLTDGILLAHKGTLRYLALLDAFDSEYSVKYTYDLNGCRNSVYDTIKACPRLIQLELPIGWGRKEMDLKVCPFFESKIYNHWQ